ncbi:MAG: PQQ-binding-like beta-propeller repeat protein, partial [Lacipirellulaceae bacterium]
MQRLFAGRRGGGAPAVSAPTLKVVPARSGRGLSLGSLLAVVVLGIAPNGRAADWPTWRGPSYNGVSDERGLIDKWNPKGGEGSNLVWRSGALGGRSTPVVLGNKLYTIVRDQPATETEGEKVVCADAATGKVLWEHRFNVYLSDVPDTRVGWSSVAADPGTGRVYAQGVCGYLCCLDGADGKVIWSRSLHEELGLISTYGGRTNFPLVYGDSVIVSAVVVGWGDEPKWGLLAKPAHRFMGFDKGTGELRWLNGTSLAPYDTTYSTPTIAKLAGQPALVFGSGDGGIWALQAGTGKPLWKCVVARMGVNVSPVVDSTGRVYAAHSEENPIGNTMGAVVAI